MLRCIDGSYYVGSTRRSLEERVAVHEAGVVEGYTASRRPVSLVFNEYFDRITDAFSAERRLKGWSRAKKEALIAGDYARIQELAKRRTMKRK
jgi:putative endonuclease